MECDCFVRTMKGIILLYVTIVVHFTMAKEQNNLKLVLEGNGDLTRNVYQILAREKGNVFFSPISIHAVLAMAAQGSSGTTKEAFSKALKIPSTEVAAKGYKDVIKRLNSVEDVTLHMANKIFIKNKYNLKGAFKSAVEENFFSEVQPVNFSASIEAARTINSWVGEKTNHKIKDLISSDSLNDDTRLVLINAIYFKGKWAHPFNPIHTKQEKFYINDQDTVDVQMMHIKEKFYYKNDNDLKAKVLELPYKNKDISMVIILPEERNGIAALEKKLASADLTKITNDMHRPEVILSLPKFKIETSMDLKGILEEIGLGEIFDDRADFSNMLESPEPLVVSKAIQKAFIEVNEEGAEASAATGLQIELMSMPAPPKQFIVDHPFILLLQANDEGKKNILFGGRVAKPIYS